MDAFIACHDAKYTYRLIRSSQADPAIPLSVPLPTFPASPTNHASKADRLNGLAADAALSRVVGGLHCRLDGDVGLALGRQVAAWAIKADVHGLAPFGTE